MGNNKIIIAAAGCLLFSGLTFASNERPVRVTEPVLSPSSSAVPEQVTTNMLLRQILAEVIKANTVKSDNRCSDGEKRYSPGYVISTGKKTLRCNTGNGYPEWVEDKA